MGIVGVLDLNWHLSYAMDNSSLLNLVLPIVAISVLLILRKVYSFYLFKRLGKRQSKMMNFIDLN